MKLFRGNNSIKLIIAIVLIIAVVIGAVQYIKYYINKENVKNMQADLLLVQAKVEIVKSNNSLNKDENPLRGYQLNQLPEQVDIKDFLEKHVITQEEYEKYYLLDSTSLEQMDLQELVNKYKGYFIVNYDNYEVIFTEGYENENKMWCYKLSDLHKMPENKKIDNEQKQNEGAEQAAQTEQTEQNGENVQ